MGDERLTDAEQHFKTSVYYTCMDTVISQLTCRFEGMRTVAERFRCIHPSALLADDDDKLHAQAQDLAIRYNQDLSVDFPKHLLSFRNMKSKFEKLSKATIKDLAEMLIVKLSSIMTSVPDVVTVFKIFLTLPVTVASTERSFSKLKLIKNYMRSTMSQDRLSGLSILSIENERARNLDLSSSQKKCKTQTPLFIIPSDISSHTDYFTVFGCIFCVYS